MAAGNTYVSAFMADFNRRFAMSSRNPSDAHRAVLHDARDLPVRLVGEGGKTVRSRVDIMKTA